MSILQETKKVSPMVKVAGTEVDVREIITKLESDKVFNVVDVLEALSIEGAQKHDGLEVLAAMYPFAHIEWTKQDATEKEKARWGYAVRGQYSPEEMVEVKRTHGFSAGMGGAHTVPEAIVAERYPKSDGWDITCRYVLAEALSQQ